MNLPKLSESDLITGAIYGLVSYAVVGPWALLVTLATALLWALGGAGFLGFNTWRRIGCPMVMCSIFYLHGHHWALLSAPLQFGALCIGYGVPDVNDPKGSWLGRTFKEYTRPVWFLILGMAMSVMFI